MNNECEKKVNLIEAKGFKYIVKKDVWFNVSTLRCMSVEWIDRANLNAVKSILNKQNKKRKIIFHFVKIPQGQTREELEKFLLYDFAYQEKLL